MEIPLHAEVRCTSEPCGESVALVLNPVTEKVTHLVVRENHFPHMERLVPLDLVLESAAKHITLRCTPKEMEKMDAFLETQFLQVDQPTYLAAGPTYTWPFVVPELDTALVPLEHECIPPDELAIRRGAPVEAADGAAGRVDEFLVDPTDSRITHLVMREGHLWGQRDVTIPVSQIARIEEDTVHLKISRQEVERLPSIPIRRQSS